MAKLSSDGTQVTVEAGDTLWGIAEQYGKGGPTYKELADINGIPNPNRIYVGQVIKLSGSSSTTSPSSNSNRADVRLAPLSTDDKKLFATWTWGKENQTDSYKIEWEYRIAVSKVWAKPDDQIWIKTDQTNTIDEDADADRRALARMAEFTIPDDALEVRVRVLPKSKTHKVTKNGKETDEVYWTASWSTYQTWRIAQFAETPSAPTVSIKKYELTATLESLADDVIQIGFQVYKDDTDQLFAGIRADVTKVTRTATAKFNVDPGATYKVRCKAFTDTTFSKWSDFSSSVSTMPATPAGIKTIKATSATSVFLEWDAVNTAETYDIEYSTKKEYFDITDQPQSKTGIESTSWELTGLESGYEYFFRIRAVNTEGASGWSDIKSVTIGKAPSAPTTWSSSTTVITGEKLYLYWIHNTQDGSSQTYADLELYVDGVKEVIADIKNSTNEEEKDKTSVYEIDTSSYIEGTKIQWRVRTMGVTKEYGEWSTQRTIDVYAPPTLELRVTNQNGDVIETLNSFPFYVYALAGPKTQMPTGYYLEVISNDIYEAVDNIGNTKTVKAGGAVYSKYFDTSDALLVEMSAGNIDLENGINYTVRVTVSMNSGLRTEASVDFDVSWVDEQYAPNAEIGIDEDTYVAYIRPYCENRSMEFHRVNDANEVTDEKLANVNNIYTDTGERVMVGAYSDGNTCLYCNNIDDGISYEVVNAGSYAKTDKIVDVSTVTPARTSTGEFMRLGVLDNGDEIYFCEVETRELVEGISLAVYRREFNGEFVEIGTGLDNVRNSYVTDPHPALDYARYRIVATVDATGAVSYYDIPGYRVGCSSIIIQWDEAWTNFDTYGEQYSSQPPWSGSLLKLPYNVDTSESNTIDMTLVEYAGRKNPVSYYGTQKGYKCNLSAEIPADDKETLYQLRRLADWSGDVYVREPSGIGYWATVAVSMSQTHLDLTIPVSINVTRVEGGM